MSFWMQVEYLRFVLPSLFLNTVFLGLLAIAVLVTHKITRKRILRDVHLHIDEHTRAQVTEWRARVGSLEEENERLRRRCNSLVVMIRGATNALTGVEAEPEKRNE